MSASNLHVPATVAASLAGPFYILWIEELESCQSEGTQTSPINT